MCRAEFVLPELQIKLNGAHPRLGEEGEVHAFPGEVEIGPKSQLPSYRARARDEREEH